MMAFGFAVSKLIDDYGYEDLYNDIPKIKKRIKKEPQNNELSSAFDAYMNVIKRQNPKQYKTKPGKAGYLWHATDVKTGKVFTRKKVAELSEILSIPYSTIVNGKRDDRLIRGRYKITAEETDMPPEPRKSTKGLGPYIWKAIDIETKKVIETGSLASLANELSIGEGRIYNAELTGKLVEGKYKIIKKSNPKAIGKWQATNTKTGETIKTRTAVEMSRLISFNRVTIYDHAKNGIPLGDYIIKHKK